MPWRGWAAGAGCRGGMSRPIGIIPPPSRLFPPREVESLGGTPAPPPPYRPPREGGAPPASPGELLLVP
eukprot:scaffold420291_cov46-Prasinocladus_malaysianus.AAC.1